MEGGEEEWYLSYVNMEGSVILCVNKEGRKRSGTQCVNLEGGEEEEEWYPIDVLTWDMC